MPPPPKKLLQCKNTLRLEIIYEGLIGCRKRINQWIKKCNKFKVFFRTASLWSLNKSSELVLRSFLFLYLIQFIFYPYAGGFVPCKYSGLSNYLSQRKVFQVVQIVLHDTTYQMLLLTLLNKIYMPFLVRIAHSNNILFIKIDFFIQVSFKLCWKMPLDLPESCLLSRVSLVNIKSAMNIFVFNFFFKYSPLHSV